MAYHFEETEDRSTFWLEPRIELGPAQPILSEMPLLAIATLGVGHLGEPIGGALIELSHSPPRYAERFAGAAHCQVRFNARRDAIHLPSSLCR